MGSLLPFWFIFRSKRNKYYSMEVLRDRKICVLGSANNDHFVYVNNIPTPGQTIQSDKQLSANGGKGANQAVAAARLSGSSVFLGQVGMDQEKELLEKEMVDSKVDLQWLVKEGVPTGKAIIMMDTKGENSIIIIGGANTAYASLDQLPQQFVKGIESCDILMLQKEIPTQINVLAAKLASQLKKVVILDCGGSDEAIPEELLRNLTILSPNDTEMLRIDSTIDTGNVVQETRLKIISKYPQLTVLLKMGSNGARAITSTLDVAVTVVNKLNPQISKDYKIIDTVGAGDCFTAAFATKYVQLGVSTPSAEDLEECILFGNAAAFLCITKHGAMPSLPFRAEVDQFLEKYTLLPHK